MEGASTGSAARLAELGEAAASLSMAHRNAARVLPEPVGATTSVCSPALMAAHAPAWAAVGAVKLLENHARVAVEKRSSTSEPGPIVIVGTLCHGRLTVSRLSIVG